ncbi:site-specific DNA-methyltransferase [Candidatus Desantisbacteria bacterium CG07_land_8_20_14_0_80_39_15]|uniref:Methyltransferase n=3 Tax=unclassified Candidatus Desantisiibacteriota TaxID=3106372 RepID=A0A2H9PBV3_9BACT|nr:MAG: site-specific DNA-methyltransferase [Candidatus Desantisbacteria bacterium CG07_land_8_20_14_0_80_39_15]PIZ16501.1 MAG: site-specific DNA-methyltransferase [Candidatus Desantisbacteria bacterium CG_4_10_14_0_8_um_filter_39_17]
MDNQTNSTIMLGKQNPAPRNRTLFLIEQDYKKYSNFYTLEEKVDDIAEVKNKIILGDCIKGMSCLPDDSIDLIFADPPYYKVDKNYGNGTLKTKTKKQYAEWSEKWIKESARILKKNGSIYICCGWESSGLIQEILEKYFMVKNRITWRREKGRGASKNWKENMEDIWFAVKSKDYIFNIEDVKIKKEIIAPYRYGGKGGQPKGWVEVNGERYRYTHPSNIWVDMVVPFWSMPENTPHPTQKPEKLLERIILASSNEGNLVLDPFLGSGTTAIVAKKLGRNYIGFEVNKDYIRLALKRLDKIENLLI